jgi:hypothetical protein
MCKSHQFNISKVLPVVLLAALMLLPSIPVLSQSIVIVRISPPPPNQLSVADLWQLELTYVSPTGAAPAPLLVYLIGTVEVQREGLVGEARSANVLLNAGLNRLSGREVQPVNVSYASSRYREAMVRTGSFPAGNYTICVTAFEAQSGREVGRDCIDHEVQPYSPPQLITPVGGDVVSQPYPVFTWTPLAPAPPGSFIRYRFKMVRVLRSQPPDVAVQSNVSWFESANVMSTSLPYPADARTLEEGTYAWFVEAVGLRGDQVLARSEVGMFRWEPFRLEPIRAIVATLAPHGIPMPLFEELMRPCIGGDAAPVMIPRDRVIRTEN